MKRIFLLSVILGLTGFLLSITVASATSIGVTPGKMSFTVQPGERLVQTLHVVNPDSKTSKYILFFEGTNTAWFTISPQKFNLESHQQQDVTISFAPPVKATAEEYDIILCIVSIPQDSELLVGAGVKVPVHVIITELPAKTEPWWLYAAGLLAIGIAVSLLLMLWRRKKHA